MKNLLEDINKRNIRLEVREGKLKLHTNGDDIPVELLNKIKGKKQEIIDFLLKHGETNGNNRHQIPEANQQKNYPLSSSQRRLWLLSLSQDSNIAYNISSVYELNGSLDINALENAFKKLIERHEILRTNFKENEDNEVRQFVKHFNEIEFRIDRNDIGLGQGSHAQLDTLLNEFNNSPFDLKNDLLLKARIWKVKSDKYVFSLTIHHIISDGWSMEILIRELLQYYDSFINFQNLQIEPLRIQYKDYSVWQQQQLTGENSKKEKQYWLDKMKGELPVLELPADHIRPNIRTFNGVLIKKKFSVEIINNFKKIVHEKGATFFMGLMSAVNAILFKYSNQKDIIIGSPIAGREHPDLENQIGFYLNTLALRVQFNETDSFNQLLDQVKATTLGSYEHQFYPFDELVEALKIKPDLSRNILFDVWVVYQNIEKKSIGESLKLSNVSLKEIKLDEKVSSKFDLLFSFEEVNGELEVSLTYNSDIYKKERIVNLLRHLEQLIYEVSKVPEKPLNAIDCLTGDEKDILIRDFNSTENFYPINTIVGKFQEQVSKTPDQVAVVFGNKEMTYQKLEELSNQLAHFIKKQSLIERNDLIAIKLERSEWLITSLLAVLKTGAGYIPIDPDYPSERIEYMIEDSKCQIVIDQLFIDSFIESKDNNNSVLPQLINQQDDIAYVIYTSGTTGKPKGVMIEHRNMVNYASYIIDEFKISSGESTILLSSLSWDGVLTGLFGALFSGGSLHVVGKELLHSPVDLSEYIIASGITFLKITPPMLNLLVSVTENESIFVRSSVRLIFIGGEKINISDIRKIKQLNSAISLVNHYGPTETTVGVTTELIGNVDEIIPIGRPIANTRIYILDKNERLVPVGIPGEICISGDGLARGYLHKPELTSAKFVKNPYENEKLMYKTGDQGRWLSNGRVEYIGRKDNQVKVRGYRIELEEIEATIKQCSHIDDAAVVLSIDQSGDKVLKAFYVPKSIFSEEELFSFLSQKLPSYMMPNSFNPLDKMPLTMNGKIDRQSLELYQSNKITKHIIQPRNETEEKLLLLWRNILGLESISVTDNFFELGGQSLKAIRLYTRISKEFEVKLELNDFFNHNTLEDQAKLINGSKKTDYKSILPVAIAPNYTLSSSQRRMWVLSQFEEGNIAYNMPGAYIFDGKLEVESFIKALNTLISRHEILRTVFKENELQEIRQFIIPFEDFNFKIQTFDLSKDPEKDKKTKALLDEAFEKPFDLEKGPLIRSGLIKLKDNLHIFTFTVHHIISDGWSLVRMVNEVLTLYSSYKNGKENPYESLKIQYKDYAAWQQNLLQEEKFSKYKSYWIKQFSDEIPVLAMPSEKIRPLVRTYKGGIVKTSINPSVTSMFKQFCKKQEGTLFMGVLSVLNALLYKYSNQQDIIIGTPIAGREHVDLEDQIGVYLNTLALRTKFNEEENFIELFKKVKQTTLDGYEHQVYPFDELIDELPIRRDLSRNPLYDVMLVGQDDLIDLNSLVDATELKIGTYDEHDFTFTKLDLRFQYLEEGDHLTGTIEYNTDIFTQEFAQTLAINFSRIIEEIIARPEVSLTNLNIFSKEEREWIIDGLNATQKKYANERTLCDLFLDQRSRTPQNIAVSDGKNKLTYEELDRRSSILAGELLSKLGKSDQYVVIHQERSVNIIVSIFGILKAGKAYLPIEPAVPRERKRIILNSVSASIIITDTQNLANSGELLEDKLSLINVDDLSSDLKADLGQQKINSKDIAYIIFTSGSTGVPKGVIVQHKPVINLIEWVNNTYGLNQNDILLNTASFSFDLSVYDVFGILSCGGCIRIATSEELSDPSALTDIIYEEKITFWDSAPATLKQLTPFFRKEDKKGSDLRLVFLSGDWIPLSLPGEIKSAFPNANVIALGGATEATVWSNFFEVRSINPSWKSIPYGRPIQNAKYYILNKALHPVPFGVVGDLYIGGEVLAFGYNDKKLSDKKFIQSPFEKDKRIYYTGDKARFFQDGNIEFLGREDDQVKVRGYRIELADIESSLITYNGIDSVVVVAKGEQRGDKTLVAYLTGKLPLDITAIRSFLSKQLPAYMIPSYFVQLEKFPLTSNGKVNKKELPDPSGLALSSSIEYIAPRNNGEIRLAEMWSEILEVKSESLGIKHNFFELGGQSIKAMQLISRINKEFNVNLKPVALFGNPTIEGVTDEIEKFNWINSTHQSALTSDETERFTI
jgi:amino acid adenylation domain-containing protein